MDQLIQLVQIGKDAPLVLCLALAAFLSVAICIAFAKFPSFSKTKEPNIEKILEIALSQSNSSTSQSDLVHMADRLLSILEKGYNTHERKTGSDS